MKIVFVSEYEMERNTDWLKKGEDGKLYNTTICNEKIVVNPTTREIEQANGYEGFVATLLEDGSARIL